MHRLQTDKQAFPELVNKTARRKKIKERGGIELN